MDIDFVAFYDRGPFAWSAGGIDPADADQLVQGLITALRARAEDCPLLTVEGLQNITAIRVLIAIGDGDFGEGGAPETEDGERLDFPGAPPTPGRYQPPNA